MRLTQLAESLSESAIRQLLKLKKGSARMKALQKQRAKLMKQLAALDRKLGKAAGKAIGITPKRRRLSAAGRRRIILAQKRRWAAARAKKS